MLVSFNVPLDDPAHAAQAVSAALEIERSINQRTFGEGVRFTTRVGINTGRVIAGPVGAAHRLIYTVHGDAVNVAARLEALNKEHGTRILISESTRQLVERFRVHSARECDGARQVGTGAYIHSAKCEGAQMSFRISVLILLTAMASLAYAQSITLHHVHGLAYSGDGKRLMIPSHHGLAIYQNGKWSKAPGPEHDYMGFVATAKNLYSSGHPAPRSGFKEPFGLIRSRDGGKTWDKLGLEGETDFHLMAAGWNTNAIYVWNPEPSSRMKTAGLHFTFNDGFTCSEQGPRASPARSTRSPRIPTIATWSRLSLPKAFIFPATAANASTRSPAMGRGSRRSSISMDSTSGTALRQPADAFAPGAQGAGAAQRAAAATPERRGQLYRAKPREPRRLRDRDLRAQRLPLEGRRTKLAADRASRHGEVSEALWFRDRQAWRPDPL